MRPSQKLSMLLGPSSTTRLALAFSLLLFGALDWRLVSSVLRAIGMGAGCRVSLRWEAALAL